MSGSRFTMALTYVISIDNAHGQVITGGRLTSKQNGVPFLYVRAFNLHV
jgi:hypothetical protein